MKYLLIALFAVFAFAAAELKWDENGQYRLIETEPIKAIKYKRVLPINAYAPGAIPYSVLSTPSYAPGAIQYRVLPTHAYAPGAVQYLPYPYAPLSKANVPYYPPLAPVQYA